MRGQRRPGHWIATAGAVAAVGVLIGAVGLAPAAGAATAGLDVEMVTRDIQGKVGDKVGIAFRITNRTKVDAPANEVVITIQAPGNAQLDPADFPQPRCGAISGGRSVRCHPGGPIPAGKAAQGSFKIVLKTAGSGDGGVAVAPGGGNDRFNVKVVGGPSPTATTKSPTPKASRSQTAAPTDPALDQSIAPPVAGNGLVLPPSEETPAQPVKTSGMSFGFWVGIVAIVAALGLVGSLFYFRRKDRGEPDTGMHPIVPAPAGYQPGGGYPPAGPPAPTVYGSPQAGGYPPAQHAGPTQIISPQGPPQPYGQPPPAPPSNDQTVMFRRPEDM